MSRFRKLKLALLSCAAFIAAGPLSASAQTLNLFSSPGQPTAPSFPEVVPNNGDPIQSIRDITGFGRVFGFGSSSTDTRNVPPAGNTPAQYIELFSPLVGADYNRGTTFPSATGFAVGGTNSVTALPQVEEFRTAYGRYSPNDIVVQFSGINDFSIPSFGVITNQSALDQTVARDIEFQTEMVRQNLELGARTYVFLGLDDLGQLALFSDGPFTFGSITVGGGDPALLTEGAKRVNEGMLENLVQLQRKYGANIYFFDTALMTKLIRENPTAYGFTEAGVQPLTSCTKLIGIPTPCATGPFSEQNQFLSQDSIHYTYRAHTIMAAAIANQLAAPYTVAPQANLAAYNGRSFTGSLIRRLQTNGRENSANATNSGGPTPSFLSAPENTSQGSEKSRPLRVFAEGVRGSDDHDSRTGSVGYESDFEGLTAGFEYRLNDNIVFGAAYGFADSDVDQDSWFGGGIDLNSHSMAAFASLDTDAFFWNGVVSYGYNDFDIKRPGIIAPLTASTDGNTFVADSRSGYLFTGGPLRFGPIAGLTYSHVDIDSYTESGDPLLNQIVGDQDASSLIGSVGVQLRYASGGRGQFKSFVNVTAEKDFEGDDLRTISTALAYAPQLPIATVIPTGSDETFGKVEGGFKFDIMPSAQLQFSASSIFGDEFTAYNASGGVTFRF